MVKLTGGWIIFVGSGELEIIGQAEKVFLNFFYRKNVTWKFGVKILIAFDVTVVVESFQTVFLFSVSLKMEIL